MIRSMLVGLDGSPDSQAALELGITWAQKSDSLLVGIGVIDEPTIRKPAPAPIGGGSLRRERDDALVAAARRDVEQFLSHFSVRCAEAQVASKQLEDFGLPAERICLEAQRYDLILLGKTTHFRTGSEGAPDETLTKVLKNSPRPVVVVPEQHGESRSILIAYDGSLQAARTLQAFQSLGLHESRELHVLSVHSQQCEAARHAELAIEYLGFHDIKAERHAVASNSPATAILDVSSGLGAGLLVMGAYGKPGLRDFFLGSVTRNMLQKQPIPLFLFH